MKTTILIPVYNEGENIRNALAAIREKVRGDYQISIVYDFDEDTTLPALDAAEKDLGIAVRRIRNRYGLGVLNAIRSGFECADSAAAWSIRFLAFCRGLCPFSAKKAKTYFANSLIRVILCAEVFFRAR